MLTSFLYLQSWGQIYRQYRRASIELPFQLQTKILHGRLFSHEHWLKKISARSPKYTESNAFKFHYENELRRKIVSFQLEKRKSAWEIEIPAILTINLRSALVLNFNVLQLNSSFLNIFLDFLCHC